MSPVDDKREVKRRDLHNMQSCIHGAEGIFIALSWIDEGYLDDAYDDPAVLANARALLIAAGEALCRVTSSRF